MHIFIEFQPQITVDYSQYRLRFTSSYTHPLIHLMLDLYVATSHGQCTEQYCDTMMPQTN